MNEAFQITMVGNFVQIKLIKGFAFMDESDNAVEFTAMVDNVIAQGIKNADVYINSPGGNMWQAMEICNQLDRFENVGVTCGALVASSATYVASKYKNKAKPNMQWMIHMPANVLAVNRLEDFDSAKKQYENYLNEAVTVYAAKTGKPEEDIRAKMAATTWMNAVEAKEYGFIDEIESNSADDALPEDTAMVLSKLQCAIPEILNQAIIKTQKPKEMKEILKILSLPENATEHQALDAIKQLQANVKNAAENSVNALTAMAKEKGMDADKIAKLAAADFETTASLVNDYKPAEEVSEQKPPKGGELTELINAIKQSGSGGKKEDDEDVSIKELMRKNPSAISNMIKNDAEGFKKKFQKEYGYTPTNEELKSLNLA